MVVAEEAFLHLELLERFCYHTVDKRRYLVSLLPSEVAVGLIFCFVKVTAEAHHEHYSKQLAIALVTGNTVLAYAMNYVPSFPNC